MSSLSNINDDKKFTAQLQISTDSIKFGCLVKIAARYLTPPSMPLWNATPSQC
ncbi:Uncharacterized protein FKW44_013381 [Caligus rogercresseyi]|uniref:Uncharacterized protein n=1 Tax=Caligus rogercresseyi TaxID=217165 RepID=A0A7T8KA89_CALRO|nr:Uncharacterized protein FKW44_013381 [Caligus rogercresseyi]